MPSTGSEPPVFGEAPDPTTPIPAPQEHAAPVQTQTLPAQAPPQSPLQSAVGAAQDTKGFLPALFDFTFTHFVTPKLVRFVYLLATIALGIAWLFWVFVGFARGREAMTSDAATIFEQLFAASDDCFVYIFLGVAGAGGKWLEGLVVLLEQKRGDVGGMLCLRFLVKMR